MSTADMSAFVRSQAWEGIVKDLRLSRREREILEGFLCEHNDTATADRLQISIHTVHTYVERLYRKLETGTRSGAIVRVFIAYLANAEAAAREVHVPCASDRIQTDLQTQPVQANLKP